MTFHSDRVRLTALSHGAGCACKLDPSVLDAVLAGLGTPNDPNLIVGTDHGDDALVWKRPDGRSLVATTDFFTPIVDDPRTWGRIAATNAVSDVYAMGATPLFGLNLVGWPSGVDPELLLEVIAGGIDASRAGGWVVAGGHSVDSPEPLYGQAIVGELADGPPFVNTAVEVGDLLVLTKPLGTGIAATAIKRSEPSDTAADGPWGETVAAAIASMCTLNDIAARAARRHGALAATDVTGFGLIGHTKRLADGSGVTIDIDVASVPRFPGLESLITAGFVPGGTQRNLTWLGDALDPGSADDIATAIVADPQSSGGLLVALDERRAAHFLRELDDHGQPGVVVGHAVERSCPTDRPHPISVRL